MRVRCSLWDETSNSILIFNPYFEFENDTGKKPNRQQYHRLRNACAFYLPQKLRTLAWLGAVSLGGYLFSHGKVKVESQPDMEKEESGPHGLSLNTSLDV